MPFPLEFEDLEDDLVDAGGVGQVELIWYGASGFDPDNVRLGSGAIDHDTG